MLTCARKYKYTYSSIGSSNINLSNDSIYKIHATCVIYFSSTHSRLQTEIPSPEEILKEATLLEHHLKQLNSPVVFCHNDILQKNILYNEELGNNQLCFADICLCKNTKHHVNMPAFAIITTTKKSIPFRFWHMLAVQLFVLYFQ